MPQVDPSIDYYRALGVPDGASADAIKQAYRQLAREYHPDRTGGDVAKAERFKTIAAAYEVLGDPESRAKYDQLRTLGPMGPIPDPGAFDLGDIFAQFVSMAGARRPAQPQPQVPPRPRAHRPREASAFDAAGSTIFAADGSPLRVDGTDVHSDLRLRFDLAIQGTTATVSTLDGKAELRIPPRMSSGKKLRLRGQGIENLSFGERGDHYITIHLDIPDTLEETLRVLEQVTRATRAAVKAT